MPSDVCRLIRNRAAAGIAASLFLSAVFAVAASPARAQQTHQYGWEKATLDDHAKNGIDFYGRKGDNSFHDKPFAWIALQNRYHVRVTFDLAWDIYNEDGSHQHYTQSFDIKPDSVREDGGDFFTIPSATTLQEGNAAWDALRISFKNITITKLSAAKESDPNGEVAQLWPPVPGGAAPGGGNTPSGGTGGAPGGGGTSALRPTSSPGSGAGWTAWTKSASGLYQYHSRRAAGNTWDYEVQSLDTVPLSFLLGDSATPVKVAPGDSYSVNSTEQRFLIQASEVRDSPATAPVANTPYGNGHWKVVPYDIPAEDYKNPYVHKDIVATNAGSGARLGHNYDLAIAAFSKAVSLNPNNLGALQSLAESLDSAGDVNAAIANFKKVLALNEQGVAHEDFEKVSPDFVYLALGDCYVEVKDYDTAASMYKKGLQAGPENGDLYQSFAQLMLLENNLPQAKIYADKALKYSDTNEYVDHPGESSRTDAQKLVKKIDKAIADSKSGTAKKTAVITGKTGAGNGPASAAVVVDLPLGSLITSNAPAGAPTSASAGPPVAAATTPDAAQTPPEPAGSDFEPGKQFSASANPSGVWSYGWSSTIGGSFTKSEKFFVAPENVSVWVGGDSLPSVQMNASGADIKLGDAVMKAGQIAVHPGGDGSFAVLRFTTPVDGQYTISGRFFGLNTAPTTTDVHIVIGGMSFFDADINGYGDPSAHAFSLERRLKKGQTLDFVVGWGSNQNYFSDLTGIDLAIHRAQ